MDENGTTARTRCPRAARHADERLRHQEIIAREYLKGRLQAEIAEELGLSIATVKRDLVKVRERWLKSSLRDFDALRAEQLAKIDTVEAEAWTMWMRSCERRVRTSVQELEATKYPGTNTRTDDEDGSGEPRYLQITLQCVERRARLLGLDAPQKVAQTDSQGRDTQHSRDVRDMSDRDFEAEILELETKRVDHMPDAEFKDYILAITRGRFEATKVEGAKDERPLYLRDKAFK
ncbi:hypothetical protein FV139_01415 [Parahaliea maris]|uniref:RNA polymerase sigma-70 ECF-like HTH domain-containing protein n=1 Tax=Parahaliea maris TaxID=2716870 RepID=A0A5C9A5K9_9GAMM|nr:ECF-type sigma factor [Parahaliea maris]TXS96193.1 hypothetical protein FV139_01415 [Parahaliea maris]